MKYGLIGEKLGHSFSKEIHEMLGYYTYELHEIAKSDIDSFMKNHDFLGINVTIPYKETVIPYLDNISPQALSIGAVNTIINKNGVLNTVLMSMGMEPVTILNTPAAVVFGMVYEYLPFMILPIYNSMARIKKDYIEAAHDLGANDFIIFFKIIIPLTLSGIISGIVMVFVPALTSFAVSELLGGGKVLLIGNVIEESFMQGMQWNAGSSLSLVLMIFVMVSMTIMNIFDKDGEGTAVW